MNSSLKITQLKMSRTLVFLAAGLLASAGAMAEKPEWAGHGKQGKPEQQQGQGQPNRSAQADGNAAPRQAQANQHGKSARAPQARVGSYFNDEQRTVVRNYYGEQYRVGNCPPGLAKKNNRCMPPGQARKWNVGQPLSRDVVYYRVPQSVIIQLGAPPAGHRYVRVASDILLLAIGTGMVVDAVQNLGGL